jgi:hypothetical protein
MRLTKAAFAVILKYSETLDKFNCLTTDIEIIAISLPEDANGIAREKAIVKELSSNSDFELLVSKW